MTDEREQGDQSSSRDSPEQASPPSLHVINAVADVEECDPREAPPLYEAVDPETLDAFVTSPGMDSVTFTYAGYTIRVEKNGQVTVEDDHHEMGT